MFPSHCTKNEVFHWGFLRSHLLKRSLMENFIFCAMSHTTRTTRLATKRWQHWSLMAKWSFSRYSLCKICRDTVFLLFGFSRIRTELRFFPYTGKYGSEKTLVMAYLTKRFCRHFNCLTKKFCRHFNCQVNWQLHEFND